MHILFVWSYLDYPKIAVEFLDRIRRRGYRVSALLANCQKETDVVLSNDKIDFHFASSWGILSKIMNTPYPVFRDVSRYIKMINPDVIHINSHLFLTSYQAVQAARSMGIPSVVTVHGFMVERSMFLDALQRVYMRTVAKSIFENSSAIICLTEKDAASVVSITRSHSKISIVPNGVDIQLFKPSHEKDSNLIAWVGRFVHEKGLVYLLKAVQEIVKHNRNTKLVLAGDGPLRFELMLLASKLGLNGIVIFPGSVSRTEVAQLLSKSSIFAFPSLSEGMPLALLEAMASGNAVVASNIPGIDELVTNNYNSILVPPKSPSELANSIMMLLDDEELRLRLADNAQITVRQNHSWDVVIPRLETVYESIGVAK